MPNLFNAIEDENHAAFDLLCQQPNMRMARNERGWTPLMACVFHGYSDHAKKLLAYPDDINAVDNIGMSALHHAVRYYGEGDTETPCLASIRALFESRIDSSLRNINGHTAMDLAVLAHLTYSQDKGRAKSGKYDAQTEGYSPALLLMMELGADMDGMASATVLAFPELYPPKLVAVMQQQHFEAGTPAASHARRRNRL